MSKTKVNCPTCEKSQEWSTDNPFRPFCSERCKMIDLGAWANEEYQIPESKAASDFSSAVHEDESPNDQANPATMH